MAQTTMRSWVIMQSDFMRHYYAIYACIQVFRPIKYCSNLETMPNLATMDSPDDTCTPLSSKTPRVWPRIHLW